MIPPFHLHRPTSLEEAVGLLATLGDEARIHAGGTELVLMLREGFVSAAHLVDIKGIGELSQIRMDADEDLIVLGATVRHDGIAQHPLVRDRLPVLAAVERTLANQRVRNAGTIGGNLAFGEPHADPPALLIAADAQLRLESAAGSRFVSLDGWIRGPFEVDLEPGELLAEVAIPMARPGTAFGYRRFKALERPSVSAAVRLSADDEGRILGSRLVLGCLGGAPQVIEATGAILASLSLADIERVVPDLQAAVAAEADTASDLHGPEDYKRHMAGVLAGRALLDAAGALALPPRAATAPRQPA